MPGKPETPQEQNEKTTFGMLQDHLLGHKTRGRLQGAGLDPEGLFNWGWGGEGGTESPRLEQSGESRKWGKRMRTGFCGIFF